MPNICIVFTLSKRNLTNTKWKTHTKIKVVESKFKWRTFSVYKTKINGKRKQKTLSIDVMIQKVPLCSITKNNLA